MGDLSFTGTPATTHQCTSHRNGDWITWRCPHCPDYERKLNWRTGEMSVKRGKSGVQHMGTSTKEQNMEGLVKGQNLN